MCYIIVINTGQRQDICVNIPNKGERFATQSFIKTATRIAENHVKTSIAGMDVQPVIIVCRGGGRLYCVHIHDNAVP